MILQYQYYRTDGVLRTRYIWGCPKRAGGILGRIGPSYPQRAGGCCDAARAGGQMRQCGVDSGQIFSKLISFCVQLIAFSVLTFYIVAWHNKLWKQSSFHSIKELIP